MGRLDPIENIPKTQIYYNFFSTKKFKDVLTCCCKRESGKKAQLIEQVLIGALAAVELDCIADLENEELDANLTTEHYKQYIQIANDVMEENGLSHEEVRNFICRMKKYCKTVEEKIAFLE